MDFVLNYGDIENAILKFPGMKHCVVNSFDTNGEKNLCAYYTSTQEIHEEQLKEFLNQELPHYMVPGYFMRLETIPVNLNGKADRKALPIPYVTQIEKEYVAPKNEIEKEVQQCVDEVLKRECISCETDLFDVGLTSLGVISIITKLSTMGHALRVKDFYECHTISEIAEVLRLKNQIVNDDDADKAFGDVSDIQGHLLPLKENGAILLTGATSFLGIHIIRELMKQTQKDIYCLVRNVKKFEKYVKEYTTLDCHDTRLKIILGDITKDHLGIEDNLLGEIENHVSDIIHCAANVSFFCPWETSKKTNYDGTVNVLHFAEVAHAKLHHISTMSVSGDILTNQTKESPDFTENELYIGQQYQENVYVHSKYLAEREVIQAIRDNKVNASIYRVANLTWRVADGKFQENYEANDLYMITKVMLHYNKIPLELVNEDLSMAPVDECAQAIVKLLSAKENKIYHLYSNYSLDMVKYIRAYTTPDVVTLKDFANLLKKDSATYPEANFVLMYIASIIQHPTQTIVSFQNNETTQYLKKIGFTWSELDENYATGIQKLIQ